MNKVVTSLIYIAMAPALLLSAGETQEPMPFPEAHDVVAQCPNRCRGDFPDTRDRKYAKVTDMRQTG
jgi:hypothetical protein